MTDFDLASRRSATRLAMIILLVTGWISSVARAQTSDADPATAPEPSEGVDPAEGEPPAADATEAERQAENAGPTYDAEPNAEERAAIDSTVEVPRDTAGTTHIEAEKAAAAAPPAPNRASESRSTTYGGAAGEGDLLYDFSGYFRAPLRMGFGERTYPAEGQSSRTFHRPIVPDDQYLSWQYLGRGNDWAELFFSVGTDVVQGTVGITGFQFTDASWARPDAQFGITLGYLTLTPDLPWKNVRFEAKAGAHWNRYGQAGKYDSGKYDTFLFGRTHVLGYTMRAEIDLGPVTLWGEQGFGTKQPNPSIYNNARFTLMHHWHGGLDYEFLKFGFHYLSSFAKEEAREGAQGINGVPPDEQPDGYMSVLGPEIRLDGKKAGELYLAYSRIDLKYAVTVGNAIEVIHSQGGGVFNQGVTSNYLDGGNPATTSGGNGVVNTLAGQYEFHANRVIDALGKRDVTLFLFGMLNLVDSDDPDLDANDTTPTSSIYKVKYGVDAIGEIMPWFGMAMRWDRVQPNSEIPEQSFTTIYPRLIFRSDFVSHEMITLGYVRYFYAERTCGTDPIRCVQPPSAPQLGGFGATTGNQDPDTRAAPGFINNGVFVPQNPDKSMVILEASMWW